MYLCFTLRFASLTAAKFGRNIKVGHGGTLDQMAEGVLVLGVGSGTKELTQFLACSKRYVVSRVSMKSASLMRLKVDARMGSETDSLDLDGNIVSEAPCTHVTEEMLLVRYSILPSAAKTITVIAGSLAKLQRQHHANSSAILSPEAWRQAGL